MEKDKKEVSRKSLSSIIIGGLFAALTVCPFGLYAESQTQTQTQTQTQEPVQEEPVISETVQEAYKLEETSPKNLSAGDIVVPVTTVVEEKNVEVLVDVPPIFPGGQRAIYQFLSENINYPEAAIRDNIEGTVMVKFAVEENGNVSNVEVAEATNSDLDSEAVRVVSLLPDFKPAISQGHPVRVFITMPILFMLDSQMKGLEYDED